MNQLNPAKRAQVIAVLVEGNSIPATVRMTGASKNAIQRLLAALGPACERYQNRVLRNLPCKRIQCDEVWWRIPRTQRCKDRRSTGRQEFRPKTC